jgi:hypothetical protein
VSEVPESIAERVWARRELGEPCVDVSAWLDRIGYQVLPEEIDTIAALHTQRRDDHASTPDPASRWQSRRPVITPAMRGCPIDR